MSLQIKRGIEEDRTGETFADGEPIWVTDTKKLYVGDGATAGGNAVVQGLAGTKVYYVSDTSGGTVNRKLTFVDGLLTGET